MKCLLSLYFLFLFAIPLFGQKSNYRIHYDYITDSTGQVKKDTTSKYLLISNENSWGLIDRKGNIVIPLNKYQHIQMDNKGMILAKKNRKYGYIDIHDNILIPFIYNDIGVFSECVDLAPAVKNKKQGFINRKGETVIPFVYDYSSRVRYFYEPGIAVLLKNGKYGVINAENKIIVPFMYTEIKFDRGDHFVKVWQKEKWACFSITGEQLSDFNNFKIVDKSSLMCYFPNDTKNLPILVETGGNEKYFSELHSDIRYLNGSEKEKIELKVRGGKQFALVDKYHHFIVPFGQYDYMGRFGLGRKAIVANKGKYGIINESGELVLPLEYDFIEQPRSYSNCAHIFLATKGNTVTLFDQHLNIVPTEGITSYRNEMNNIFITNKENKMGLIDYKGIQIVPFQYDTLYYERSFRKTHTLIAKKDNFYGLISINNNIIQPFKYKFIYAVADETAYVDQNNKVGILRADGTTMIPFEYDAIYRTWYDRPEKEFPDTEAIFIVEKEGKIGTVDDKNNVIIPIIYDGLSGWIEYGHDAHYVKNNDKYGIISHKGKIIIPIEYEWIGLPEHNVIDVKKEGKYGVVSYKNKVILPCIYDRIYLDIPWFSLEKDKFPKIVALYQNKWRYYDLKGKLLHSNVPLKEIKQEYDFLLNPVNLPDEYYDLYSLDMKLKNGFKIWIDEQ